MKKYKTKPSHRIIAMFFTITFLQTLIPYNQLWANNNGPNAPEAGSFEPVDATDMVNLATGDLSYVLPLLNIPSPEGGYPLALSYHAGIAMDQEASWVGLGWNLNPGAINRSVNGYADDYIDSPLSEYFYDSGGSESVYSISVGYSFGASIGVGYSWGSNRASSGHISMGVGIPVGNGSIGVNYQGGNAGSSLEIGYTSTSGLSLGASASSSGGVGGNFGYAPKNGTGFNISGASNGTYGLSYIKNNKTGNNYSLGFNLSSSGVGLSASVNSIGFNTNTSGSNIKASGVGIGLNFASNNAISKGDYTTMSTSYNIALVVPTPVGIFSLSHGKQKFKYRLGKNEYNFVTGPLNFSKNIASQSGFKIYCTYANGQFQTYNGVVGSEEQKESVITSYGSCNSCECSVTEVPLSGFMDTYEINLFNEDKIVKSDVTLVPNTMNFPAYDKYNVQAQGLSGSISAKYNEAGGLFSLSNKETTNPFSVNYISHENFTIPAEFRFHQKPKFHFDHEIGSFVDIPTVDFASSNDYVLNNYDENSLYQNRKKRASYIEHYTNEEIVDNYNEIKNEGFLNSNAIGFSRELFPESGIGAFKITSPDGKTYHYSLPVYNHEIVTRTFGHIKNRPNENQAYIEKRQLEPYATHWLLTAVTGPDYLDNGDGIANDGDLGYWTSFEYGKWSDAFIWKNPYDTDLIEHDGNENVKTRIRGRKQVYYLNKVKTRTHTALFVKSIRNDAKSIEWDYSSVNHIDDIPQTNNPYTHKFSVPSQRQLKLDKIVLLKNKDANGITTHGTNEVLTCDYLEVKYNQSEKENETASYNCFENILNANDLNDDSLQKSIKTIDFQYASAFNSLVKNTPNTEVQGQGRLTLDKVYFNGKQDTSVIPPYQFDYENRNYSYDKESQGAWGYHQSIPHQWSLNEITMPQGSKIKIEYEKHRATSSIDHELVFSNNNAENFTSTTPNIANLNDISNKKIIISGGKNSPVPIALGDKVSIKYGMEEEYASWTNNVWRGAIYPCFNGKFMDAKYDGTGTVSAILGNNSYEVSFDNNINIQTTTRTCDGQLISDGFNGNYTGDDGIRKAWTTQDWEQFYRPIRVIFNATGKVFEIGNSRIKSLSLIDNITEIKTNYSYGENDNGVGKLSYLPYAPKLTDELPHSLELPPALVMYDYVAVTPNTQNGVSKEKLQYKFEVFPDKSESEDTFNFGDVYEIKTNTLASAPYPNWNNTETQYLKYRQEFEIKDKLSQLGRLLEVSSFNSKGQLVKKTINNYLSEDEIIENTEANIGIEEESYQTYKTVNYNSSNLVTRSYYSSSKRIKYPNILKSTTEIVGGNTYETKFINYDVTSGQSLEQITMDSQKNELKIKAIPAFKVLEYSNNINGYSMASKVDNVTNKNMLTQTVASLTQIKDAVGDWKTINADINTWNNNWTYRNYDGDTNDPSQQSDAEKIWRKHQTFIWKGEVDADGTYEGYTGDDDGFNWSDPENQTNWIKTSEVSLYDHYSMPLESIDINQNKASTKMGDDNSKVFAVANAGYTAMYYSGAEDLITGTNYFSGEVSKGSTATLSDTYHTGVKAIEAAANAKAFSVKPEAGNYKASVWIHKGTNDNYTNTKLRAGGSVIVHHPSEVIPAGDWIQLNFYTGDIGANQEVYVYNTSGTTIYDDFRLLPIASSMTSYVYNEWDELSYIIGANNLATKYEYDDAGRLKKTYAEVMDTPGIKGGFKLSKEINYNYSQPAQTSTNNNPNALTLSLGIGDPNVSTTTLTATANGGSYEYEYRFAIGTSSSNLSYGGWSANNTISLTTSCATGGRRHYKGQVRDKNYQTTTEQSGNHQRGECGIDGDGDPINQQ